MNDYLNNIIRQLQSESCTDQGEDNIRVLSTGERCYVALSTNRYDLLPASYDDPIEAWHRLERRWQLGVCNWRGWPETFAIN